MEGLFNEIVEAREATYLQLAEPIRSYFTALAEVFGGVGGFDPEDMFAKIKQAAAIKLQRYPPLGANWFDNVIATIETEEAAFAAYEKLVNIVRDDTLYDILGRSISHTKMQKAMADRKFISSIWLEYAPVRAIDNKVLIGRISAEIVENAVEEAFVYVTTKPLVGLSIIILRRLLNSNITETKKKLLRNTVDVNLRGLFSKDPLRGVGFLSRHGLVPATESMAWEKVTEGLDIGSKIVITYSTGSGLEFDIRGLVDENYIMKNELEVVDGCGLNKKVIKRFITTRVLDSPRAEWSIEVTGDGPYYIFESIARDLFRLMREATHATARAIPAISLVEGISARAEEYHRTIGLTNPFDPRHRYVALDIATRELYTPSGELYEFVNRMQESVTEVKDFYERMLEEATRVFIETFKHTTLLGLGSESMVSYLLKIEPLLDTMKERLGAAINKLDLKQLTKERVRDVVGGLSHDVIEGMIEDKSLVDYDNTYKLVYLQKRQAGIGN